MSAIFNRSGSCIGRVEGSSIFNSSGSCVGRIDGSAVFNRSGSCVGRLDGGTVFNSSGSCVGRVDGSSVFNSSWFMHWKVRCSSRRCCFVIVVVNFKSLDRILMCLNYFFVSNYNFQQRFWGHHTYSHFIIPETLTILGKYLNMMCL